MNKAASTQRSRSVAASPRDVPGASKADRNFLEDSLAYCIRRTQVRCRAILMRYLGDEISPARLAALSTVGVNPGISQSELGELLSIAGPSVVKVVDDLENLGLLTRDPSSDRRAHTLQLTQGGHHKLRRYNEAAKRFEQNIAKQLSKQERRQLIQLLRRVAAEDR